MDSVKTFKLFPVPVFEYQIPNHEKINLELKKYIYKNKEKDPKGVEISNVGGWHSQNFDIDKSLIIKKFFGKITHVLPDIFNNQMGWSCKIEQIRIMNIWSVVNHKNTFNIRHQHPNSFFSAAYYVQTNANAGQIKFFDPKEVNVMYYPTINEPNEFTSHVVKIKPEEGKLLLFPSYLHHAVGENLSDEDRIVISFNINIL